MNICIFKHCNLSQLDNIILGENDIHVWIINWKGIDTWINENISILDEDEIKEAYEFYCNDDRTRYIVGRVLTRILAANYLNIKDQEVVIKRGVYGKPYLKCDSKKRLHHNISHSGDYVLLAFSYIGSIGIDIEKQEVFEEYKEISEFFHETEYKEIYGKNGIYTFYKFWTEKEAYIKSIGKGLYVELDSFYITKDGIYQKGLKLTEYFLYSLKVAEDYSAALVINRRKEGKYEV